MSQLREDVEHVFDCFCEVTLPSNFEERLSSEEIRLKFPGSFEEKSILNEVPNFACPCPVESTVVEHFSFVLLKELKWLYGFCRRSPTDGSALVLLSALPWHDLMYSLLDTLHLVAADGGDTPLLQCLSSAYNTPVPADGDTLHFKLPDGTEFSAACPDRHRLPSLLVDRNLTEYWSVVNDDTKLEVFAALLHERHVLVTSSRLGRFSACVQAAQALLYPLWWQRIFLPVVPAARSGCLASPAAYLAGCPSSVSARLQTSDLVDDCVRLDADTSRLTTPHADLQRLPKDVVSTLRRQLKQAGPGDGVARAFQTAVLQLVGGYRHGIRRRADGGATFDQDAFLQSQPAGRRQFLRTLLNTQMFQQFIDERLSRPDPLCADSLTRQPCESPCRRRPWLKNLVGRRRFPSLSGSGRSSSVTAPLRAPVSGPLGSGGVVMAGPAAASQSAPASPANPRLRATRPSAPSLLQSTGGGGRGRTVSVNLDGRPGISSPGDDLSPSSSDDPLSGFTASAGGTSLMEEINAELQRLSGPMAEMPPLSDVPTSAPPILGGGGDSDSSDDVFAGGASRTRGASGAGGVSVPPQRRDPGLPPTANGRLPGGHTAAGRRRKGDSGPR